MRYKPTDLSRAAVYAATSSRLITIRRAPPIVAVAVPVIITHLKECHVIVYSIQTNNYGLEKKVECSVPHCRDKWSGHHSPNWAEEQRRSHTGSLCRSETDEELLTQTVTCNFLEQLSSFISCLNCITSLHVFVFFNITFPLSQGLPGLT